MISYRHSLIIQDDSEGFTYSTEDLKGVAMFIICFGNLYLNTYYLPAGREQLLEVGRKVQVVELVELGVVTGGCW